MADIGMDLYLAYEDGYERGKKETEAYLLHCGDVTPVTNADRIRAMTDEELAELFAPTDNGLKPCPKGAKYPKSCEHGCGNCWLNWLKQEVDE